MNYEASINRINEIISKNNSYKVIQRVVDFLHDNFDKYSWVGVYRVKGKNLILGPWRGPSATEHDIIPIGKGVCGSTASSAKTEIVSDVHKDDRYLSCFISTKSEIVVPIIKNQKVIGEIDIDSDKLDAFTEKDKAFLEKIADMLKEHI